jgi:hypothetical protein
MTDKDIHGEISKAFKYRRGWLGIRKDQRKVYPFTHG